MPNDGRRGMLMGTNYHLDSWRPWTARRETDAEFEGMARFGLDLVRVVGDLLVPQNDESGDIADDKLFIATLERCRRLGLRVVSLCWNIVPDAAAAAHPMRSPGGTTYPRGNWGLFNPFDDDLKGVALRVVRNTASRLAAWSDVVSYYQPTNEWILLAYPPYGWNWNWYAGDMRRALPELLSYGEDAVAAWHESLASIGETWQGKIATETGQGPGAVEPVESHVNGQFSATYLAWCRFTASRFGELMRSMYDAAKPVAGDVKVLSQSCMPWSFDVNGFPMSGLGHDVEYWLEAGRCFDLLAVNTYQDYQELPARPFHRDGDLPLQAWYQFFREIVQGYGLDGLVTTECGANSYDHSEDAQRYIVMRSLLQVAAFGRPDALCHLLWNDDAEFEPIHEQFFGITRSKHVLPKPAYLDTRLVMDVIRRDWRVETHPCGYVVYSRPTMRCGMSVGSFDALTARELDLRVTTDSLVERSGFADDCRFVVLGDSAAVSSATFIERLAALDVPVVVPITIGTYGTDADAERARARAALLGIDHPDLEPSQQGGQPHLGDGGYVELRRPKNQTADAGAPRESLSMDGLGTYRLLRSGRPLIQRADLPEGLHVLAHFDDGTVGAYRTASRVVLTFDVSTPGVDDPERVRFMRDLVRWIAPDAVRRRVRAADPDDRTLVYDVGGAVVLVNTEDADREVSVVVDGIPYRIPVGARRFSAWDAGTNAYGIISAEGAVVRDGVSLAEGVRGAYVVIDDASIAVRPFHDERGQMVTGIVADGTLLDRDRDDAGPVFHGRGVRPFGLEIESTPTLAVDADLEHRLVLSDLEGSSTQRPDPVKDALAIAEHAAQGPGSSHVVTHRATFIPRSAPDDALVEWEATEAVARIAVAASWYDEREGFQEWSCGLTVDGPTGRVLLPEMPLPMEVSMTVSVRALGPDGSPVPLSAAVLVRRFRSRRLPSFAYPVDGTAKVVRTLHPMRYEDCRITRVEGRVLSRGAWRPLRVVVGERGQHSRHLQLSEDMQEVEL